MAIIQFAINEAGRRIGDSHHRAKLTDHEVEQVLQLHSEGYGYRKLAAMFDISRSNIRHIIKGRCRAQFPAGWKVIRTET